MPSINIPEDDLPALEQLMSLPEDAFTALASAIAKTKPTFATSQFAIKISQNLKGFDPEEDILPILNVVSALYYLKERVEASAKTIAADVSHSAVESSTDEIAFPEEKRELLAKRLEMLLGFDKTLGITSKALDVMTEHEHVFCSARILSDIRPVFTGSPESAESALIVHNLQIGFHNTSEGKHQEIYIALDTDDIEDLKNIIFRTEKKTEALKAIIKSANMTYLEV